MRVEFLDQKKLPTLKGMEIVRKEDWREREREREEKKIRKKDKMKRERESEGERERERERKHELERPSQSHLAELAIWS